MEIGQPEEGLCALARLLDHGMPAVCHLGDLGRSPHDDMTIQRGKTFTREFGGARDRSRSRARDKRQARMNDSTIASSATRRSISPSCGVRRRHE
jgi:hypothetical protein